MTDAERALAALADRHRKAICASCGEVWNLHPQNQDADARDAQNWLIMQGYMVRCKRFVDE